jgi:hypothetical protein
MTKHPPFRNEYKYLIGPKLTDILRARVGAIMLPDKHNGGVYDVHNLYLDDSYDTFYYAKHHGALVRNKYRLRFYNGDKSFIRLERKHKEGHLSYKTATPVTAEQYEQIHSGDFEFTSLLQHPIWQELHTIHRLRTLRPAADYVYRRAAYVLPAGDTRITFDTGKHFPPIMELKFTGYLPEIIRNLISGMRLQRVAVSKYCLAREAQKYESF